MIHERHWISVHHFLSNQLIAKCGFISSKYAKGRINKNVYIYIVRSILRIRLPFINHDIDHDKQPSF